MWDCYIVFLPALLAKILYKSRKFIHSHGIICQDKRLPVLLRLLYIRAVSYTHLDVYKRQVCAMPDTHPAHDSAATVRQVREIARRRSVVKVEPIGALTLDRAGQTLSEMAELVEAGCVGFSDAPASIADASIMLSLIHILKDYVFRLVRLILPCIATI